MKEQTRNEISPSTRLAIGLALALVLGLVACQSPQQPPVETTDDPAGETAEAEQPAARPQPVQQAPPAGKPAAEPAPTSRPTTPPPPETMTVRLPAGTVIEVELVDALSSGTNLAGDRFVSRVAADVVHDGRVVIPAGTQILGSVEEVVSAKNKKVGGRAKMVLAFQTIALETGDVGLTGWLIQKGKSETPKDAATIGGAAVVGAIIGHQISDDDKGTAIGAIVGGAAGTAIAVNTKGKEVELPAGTIGSLELGAPLELEVPK